MQAQRPITTMKIFDAVALAKDEVASSEPIDLRELASNGYFSLHYTTTGTGTTLFEYLFCPTKDGTYLVPSAAVDIGATLAAGSDLLSFAPELGPWMKIRATEDGGVNGIGVTAWLNFQ